MKLEELLQEAKSGNMVAQYDLAEYYGKLLRETTNEDEIYNYSKQAVIWLKKSAKQGYKPAVEAVNELNKSRSESEASSDTSAASKPAPQPEAQPAAQPAANKLPSSDTVVMSALPDIPVAEAASEKSKQPEAQKQKERYFASTTHIIVVCMLIISLLINIFLLIFLFKMVNSDKPAIDDDITATASPTAAPTPSPTVRPTATPSPSPSPTVEPSPEVQESWLDLTKYTDLDVIPTEIYDDYVYYTVVVKDTLNMRSGPSTSYDKINTIPAWTKVGAVAKQDNWYLVYYKSSFGWVSGDYLSNDPKAAPSPTPTPRREEGSSGNLARN